MGVMTVICCPYRGNAVEDINELKKLKCLPYLRALVLAGMWLMNIHELYYY